MAFTGCWVPFFFSPYACYSSLEHLKLDDVIFALRERYMTAAEVVDAKKLSDGTLRCIAIAA